jgi:O-antigen ligase
MDAGRPESWGETCAHESSRLPDLLRIASILFLGLALVLAFTAPVLFWVLLGATALAGAGVLVYSHAEVASVGWLLVVGSTPEYWLGDLVGGASLIIAAEKLAGLALVAVCILRYGWRLDACNPAWAFVVMFAVGLLHGLHPRSEPLESARSLAGSVAPFAFCFSRLTRRWAAAVIATACWLPLCLVLAGVVLAAVGLHPLFVNQLGFRLQATGIPAFLGGFAATGVYACLLELFRDGSQGRLGLLLVNALILILSGARAPLAVAVVVSVALMLFKVSARFVAAQRLPLVLVAAAALPALVALASQLSDVRLFNMLAGKADSLSGRDLLWPLFVEAWSEQPWFGWGLGAAKAIVPETSLVAHLTGTTAPHNEYLRISTEGGYLGLGLLVLLMTLWTTAHTRRLPSTERAIVRLIMLGVAVHAAIDNLLISTTACVLFVWISAVFVRGALDGEPQGGQVKKPGRLATAPEQSP